MRAYISNAMLVIALAIPAAAQVKTMDTTPAPQYFTLNLPAGVSLISAPLNTGQTLGQNEFLGLPSNYTLFYGWDADSQSWVPGDQALGGLARGFSVFLPVPTTLVVSGQPYSYFTAVTDHIAPGWHLFGVPFQEGIGWQDFHLYASGNPISLDTAMAMGWIDPNVITTQGSEVQFQTTGQPLLPGVAYWVHTFVPFDLRAERQAASNTSPSSSTSSLNVTVQSAATDSTSSNALGWLGAVAEFLTQLSKGAAEFFEGNWPAASFEVAGGTFGLIDYAVGTGDTPTTQLSQMDADLDTLIVNVNAIAGQLIGLNNQIEGLTYYIQNTNDMGSTTLKDAEAWLTDYYLDQTQTLQSRNWARWYMAGCPIVASNPNLPPGCPSASNPVTSASFNAFKANYVQNPGQTSKASDDFPLWWAASVVGNVLNGVPAYAGVNGTTADGFATLIHQGLTGNPGTNSNSLMAYMHWIFTSDASCVNDVSAPGCDLYSQVYVPTEAYFLQAIGDQTQLAAAITEADGVLAERFPGTYQSRANNDMARMNQYVNEEVEVFLEVAEQIALYRAADGTQDWNTFGSSDAGQLLARADFLAMQLGRQPDPTNPATSSLTPPWPASGVVGRVFYVSGEPALTGGRTVCESPSQAFNPYQVPCVSPVGSLSEVAVSTPSAQRSPTSPSGVLSGDWPYLRWTTSSGTSTGTPTEQWTVQRLVPSNLATGSYVVASTSPTRFGASLFVGNYDSGYNNLAAPATGSIVFGSFNGIEGAIGKYALPLDTSPWTTSGPTTSHTGGGTLPKSFSFSFTTGGQTGPPAAAYLEAGYPPIPVLNVNVSPGYYTNLSESWSTTANIELVANSSSSSFPHAHIHWPTTLNVNLTGGVSDSNSSVVGGSNYYSSIVLSQVLQNSSGNTVSNSASPAAPASVQNTQCSSSGFNTCSMVNVEQSLDLGSLALSAGAKYSFTASFSTTVLPYSQSAWSDKYTFRSSTGNSAASWILSGPMITLTQ